MQIAWNIKAVQFGFVFADLKKKSFNEEKKLEHPGKDLVPLLLGEL